MILRVKDGGDTLILSVVQDLTQIYTHAAGLEFKRAEAALENWSIELINLCRGASA